MLRASRKVLVTLMPSRLEAVLMRGDKVVASASRDLDPKRWDLYWSEGLHALDNLLSELLRSLRASKCETYVIYQGREAQCDVATFPMGMDEALGAAQLAQTSEVAGTRKGLCHPLWVEQEPSIKSNVLVASDRNDTLTVLGAWVRRAGGNPSSCLPLSVLQVAESVRTLSTISTDIPVCRALIGEHTTVLAGCLGGKIAFVRTTDMGFSLLVNAVVQATAETDAPLSYAVARQHLIQHGLPARGTWGNGSAAVDRAMPLIYPILQRYVVECRQTLRFGFGTDQSHVNIELQGPGASIEGFAKSLSQQLECDVTPAGTPEEIELAPALKLVSSSGFIADSERDERRLKRLNSSIGVGLGCAILLLGGEFAMIHSEHNAVNTRLAAQAVEVTKATKELKVRREAAKIALELGRLQDVVTSAERDKLDLYAVLGELSRVVPSNVHIEDSNLTIADGTATLALSGSVSITDENIDQLSELLATLRNNPMIDAVELGSTRVVDDHGIRSKEFSVNVRLKRIVQTASGEHP